MRVKVLIGHIPLESHYDSYVDLSLSWPRLKLIGQITIPLASVNLVNQREDSNQPWF